jgi:hypothetical protein
MERRPFSDPGNLGGKLILGVALSKARADARSHVRYAVSVDGAAERTQEQG